MTEPARTPGQIAFEGYRTHVQPKVNDTILGPEWGSLETLTKTGWEAAAQAVLQEAANTIVDLTIEHAEREASDGRN